MHKDSCGWHFDHKLNRFIVVRAFNEVDVVCKNNAKNNVKNWAGINFLSLIDFSHSTWKCFYKKQWIKTALLLDTIISESLHCQ